MIPWLGRQCDYYTVLQRLMLGGLLCCTGCSLPYYAQAIHGQWALETSTRPITAVLHDPTASVALKNRLRYVLLVRRFARRDLALPLHQNYRDYANLHRPYVVWNVVAAPRLHLTLKRWCFPIAGCVSYRGYFHASAAHAYAATLRAQGYDTYVAGVPAYATLGYLHDPVLNTFLDYPRTTIAHIIFHELSHDLLYIPNATLFDESFADTVADVGVHRFLRRYGSPADNARYRRRRRRQHAVTEALQQCQNHLMQIYHSKISHAQKLKAKQAAFIALREHFQALAQQWGGDHGYRAFFNQPFNNAVLGAYSNYTSLVPALRRLLRLENGNLRAFYVAARWYGQLPRILRNQALRTRTDIVRRWPTVHPTQRVRYPIKSRLNTRLSLKRPGLASTIYYRSH